MLELGTPPDGSKMDGVCNLCFMGFMKRRVGEYCGCGGLIVYKIVSQNAEQTALVRQINMNLERET